MNYLKKISTYALLTIISIFTLSFILSTFYYFNLIDSNFYNIFKLLIIVMSLFINAFFLGKKCNKYGLFEGFKLGAIFTIIMIITILVSNYSFSIKHLIFIFIILLTTSLGSVIGINKKVDTN